MPLPPRWICGSWFPWSTEAAASVPSGPALPNAMVCSPAVSWLTLLRASLSTIVEPEVVTGTSGPTVMTTVKPPALTAVTVPIAKPCGRPGRRCARGHGPGAAGA